MDWLGDNLWAAWLGIGIALGAAEMLSLDLVLLMLAVGAMAGMVAGLLAAPVVVQVLLAAGTAVAMLAVVRPTLVRRLHSGPDLQLSHQGLVGRHAVVTQAMSGVTTGQVRVSGEEWSAKPYDDTLTIAPGETVEIFEIRGATVYVHPVPRLEN